MVGAQDQGLLSVAEAHCLRALEYGTAAPAKDKAKALLREIRRAGDARPFHQYRPICLDVCLCRVWGGDGLAFPGGQGAELAWVLLMAAVHHSAGNAAQDAAPAGA